MCAAAFGGNLFSAKQENAPIHNTEVIEEQPLEHFLIALEEYLGDCIRTVFQEWIGGL
jgi:hypothetical protein